MQTAVHDDDQCRSIVARTSIHFTSTHVHTETKQATNPSQVQYAQCWVSPDASCILTGSTGKDTNGLSLHDIPTQQTYPQPNAQPSVLKYSVKDWKHCAWYPLMVSSNPTTCVFATTSKHTCGIQLWDAYYSNVLRATYGASWKETEGMVEMGCVKMTASKIYATTLDACCTLLQHEIAYPTKLIVGKDQKCDEIRSWPLCMDVLSRDIELIALGTSHGGICLFDSRISFTKTIWTQQSVHKQGVAQVIFLITEEQDNFSMWHRTASDHAFTQNQYLLLTAGRKFDASIKIWDLRNLSSPVSEMNRTMSHTPQRLLVDTYHDTLFYGDAQTGTIHASNVMSPWDPKQIASTHSVPVNCISAQKIPRQDALVVAATSGQRPLSRNYVQEDHEGQGDQGDQQTPLPSNESSLDIFCVSYGP